MNEPTEPMSRADHEAQLLHALANVDASHKRPYDNAWRHDRRHAARRYLLHVLDGIDIDADDERFLDWLATWDAPTVAGLAALLDRARRHPR